MGAGVADTRTRTLEKCSSERIFDNYPHDNERKRARDKNGPVDGNICFGNCN